MSKVYEFVQKRIIEELEKAIENGGTAPWQKSWLGSNRPKNFITKKPYNGINLLLLPKEGEYITFKQIQQLQKKDATIQLKKGSKSNMVVFWKFPKEEEGEEEGEEEEKEKKSTPIFRYYNVFHISDVENIENLIDESLFINDDFIDDESFIKAEDLIKKYSKKEEMEIKELLSVNRAFYSSTKDYIQMPNRKQFNSLEDFYGTLFHEITHSTGHNKRLNRFTKEYDHKFGSEDYSSEELVAEIGSNMLLGYVGINNNNINTNSVSYLYGWLKAIKKDINLITIAAQKAEKAFNYIVEVN